MWPFRRRIPPVENADHYELRTLRQRLEDVEDEVGHLTTRMNRLRGQVTGWLRNPPDDDEDEPDDTDAEFQRLLRARQGGGA